MPNMWHVVLIKMSQINSPAGMKHRQSQALRGIFFSIFSNTGITTNCKKRPEIPKNSTERAQT